MGCCQRSHDIPTGNARHGTSRMPNDGYARLISRSKKRSYGGASTCELERVAAALDQAAAVYGAAQAAQVECGQPEDKIPTAFEHAYWQQVLLRGAGTTAHCSKHRALQMGLA